MLQSQCGCSSRSQLVRVTLLLPPLINLSAGTTKYTMHFSCTCMYFFPCMHVQYTKILI